MNEPGDMSEKPIHPIPDFLDLAGSLNVPAHKRGVEWDVVVSVTRRVRASVRR